MPKEDYKSSARKLTRRDPDSTSARRINSIAAEVQKDLIAYAHEHQISIVPVPDKPAADMCLQTEGLIVGIIKDPHHAAKIVAHMIEHLDKPLSGSGLLLLPPALNLRAADRAIDKLIDWGISIENSPSQDMDAVAREEIKRMDDRRAQTIARWTQQGILPRTEP